MTFEEKHPELVHPKHCEQVNYFENWEYVNGKSQLTELWERNKDGVMVDLLSEKLAADKEARVKAIQAQIDTLYAQLEEATLRF